MTRTLSIHCGSRKKVIVFTGSTRVIVRRGFEITTATRTTIFGKRCVRYQDPFRLYYAFRNEISIYRQYLVRTFLYALKIMLMRGMGRTETDQGCNEGGHQRFHGEIGEEHQVYAGSYRMQQTPSRGSEIVRSLHSP
jgi:hypothetical protein